MNRDFATTCGCIITEEKRVHMAFSFIEQHQCPTSNATPATTSNSKDNNSDISSCFTLPKRSWTTTTESIDFFSDAAEKPRRRTSTTKTTTTTTNRTKEGSNNATSSSGSNNVRPSQPEKKLHDFLSLLVSSPHSHSSDDTADLEELVSLMKAHTLFDPAHIPQPQHIELIQQLAAELPSLIPRASKFSFGGSSNNNNNNNSNSKSQAATSSKSPSKTSSSSATSSSDTTSNSGSNSFVPEPNFKFSFSSDRHANFPPPPEKPLYTTDRPTYRRGGVYAEEYDDMDTQDDLRDQVFMDPIELEAILQQRKILPLPKPRWKKKASTQITTQPATAETDVADMQQQEQQRKGQDDKGSKPAAGTGQQRIARRSAGEPGSSSRKVAAEEALVPSSSSSPSKTPAKKEPRKPASVSKRGTKDDKPSPSKSSDMTAEVITRNSTGTKAGVLAKQQQQQQSNIPKTSSSSKPVTASSSSSSPSAPGQGGSKKSRSKVKKKEAAAGKTTYNTNEDNNKKKNTNTTTTTTTATKGKRQTDATTLTKKGKKAQQQQRDQQQQQQQVQQQQKKADWLDVDLSTSDLSMITSGNPDEWICLFCQYEIFCSGLEAAIRKRGGYRRRRLLRAKEINDSILHHQDRLSEDEDPLSLVEMPVDSRIRVVAGLSHGPTLPPFQ